MKLLRFSGIFAFCLLLGGFTGGSAADLESASDLKVMLIGVDGATWDIMVPMIDGHSHESAKTVVSKNLVRDGGFESGKGPVGHSPVWRVVESPRSGKNAALVVDDNPAKAEYWLAPIDFEGVESDRLLVEGWVRHPEGRGLVTLGMRVGGSTPPFRSIETDTEWKQFRFQVMIPPGRAQGMLVIRPHGPAPGGNFRGQTGSVLLDDLTVREVRRSRFPPGGFMSKRLAGPQNKLPAFSRLIREGAYGLLGTFNPNASPSLWTTAATGKKPEDHGIPGFYFNAPGRKEPVLVNSTIRKVKALWNIVGESSDDQVAFVSWWATWPAEEVNGVIVSDHANTAARRSLVASGYLTAEDLEQHEGDRGQTHPHQLMQEILPLMVRPESVTAEMIMKFADLTPADRRKIDTIQSMEREELSLLKFKLAAHLGNEEVARHLYASRNPRLFGVYFNIVDAIEHYFWRWLEPDLFAHAPADRVAVFGETLDRIYALQDSTIHRLCELADEKTVVIIHSDHGHRPVRLASVKGKSGGHSAADPGILIISGGPARVGGVIEGATLLDITPTVLYLLGYPVARDMPGRVLTEAIEEQYLAAHPVEHIDTYEGEARAVDQVYSSAEDEKITEELRALGYIE